MACQDWPPPLPSLPLYPPCVKKQKSKGPPPIVPKNSTHQEWWNEFLSDTLKRVSGTKRPKKNPLYELTSRQRRELLPMKIPTKQDRLIWSIPLPAGSYPSDGLPIWERLYLDHSLPMLKAPSDALVFARQKIGKKLWKDTEGQEFILYDPQGYEVQFSYENVHDPHLTNYYQGKEIRGFLLSMGDANADGWGICTLRRFNQYRKYLRRVHMSRVHKEMDNQDILQDELHRVKMYKQMILKTMEQNERKAVMDEAGAAVREALEQHETNRINRLMKNIREKERRVARLYRKRAKDQEQRIKKGQKLQAEQELKKKISDEINRRKKIATLRRWHESDEKRMKLLKKNAEEKSRQKAEKVRLKWQIKIDCSRRMFNAEDELLELQAEVKKQNVMIRNNYMERLKQKQLEQFQELRNASIRKKAIAKRRKEDKNMENAIMSAWLGVLRTEYDLETEVYRVKKSLNSTMAELLSQDTEGPDRYSIISVARHRIQREQTIPLQVSFAIEALLETGIEMWATKRLNCLVETLLRQLVQHVEKRLKELKMRGKDFGTPVANKNRKIKEAKGTIFKEDEVPVPVKTVSKGKETTESSRTTIAEAEIVGEAMVDSQGRNKKAKSPVAPDIAKGVIINSVHFGPTETFEYKAEKDVRTKLKPVKGRSKTPMPSQKVLCDAGFSEERLKDILPTVSDVVGLREKTKFRRAFKNAAVQLFKRAMVITDRVCEPSSRVRTINKLIKLGETDTATVVRTLCQLLMNKAEKVMFECQEFHWISFILAKNAINAVLKPPEFQKIQNDGVARTKIMFYKPRHKTHK